MKEILIEQFTICYDENSWFVALKNALKDLTVDQASWKTEGTDYSIWGLLSHLSFYNEAYLKRFKGNNYIYPTDDNDETFLSAKDSSEKAWQAEIERFNEIMSEWRSLLEAAEESKFNESVSATNKSLWSSVVAHIILHNAHHGGQIILLRKLQGNWDKSKGVS